MEQAKFRNHSQQRQQSYWQFIIISANIDFTNQLHKYMLLISLSLAKFARFVDSWFFFESVVVVPVRNLKVDQSR